MVLVTNIRPLHFPEPRGVLRYLCQDLSDQIDFLALEARRRAWAHGSEIPAYSVRLMGLDPQNSIGNYLGPYEYISLLKPKCRGFRV